MTCPTSFSQHRHKPVCLFAISILELVSLQRGMMLQKSYGQSAQRKNCECEGEVRAVSCSGVLCEEAIALICVAWQGLSVSSALRASFRGEREEAAWRKNWKSSDVSRHVFVLPEESSQACRVSGEEVGATVLLLVDKNNILRRLLFKI